MTAPLVTLVVLVASALGADAILDVLDLSPEGFWIAAGVLLLVPALPMVRNGDVRELVGPAPVAAVMSFATRDGQLAGLVVAVLVAAAAYVIDQRGDPPRWAGRVLAGSLVVLAFDLIRDGVIAV